MPLSTTLRYITGHPLNQKQPLKGLLGFLKWQVGVRLVPGPVVYDWIDGAKLVIRRGETSLTCNVYCGIDEFYDMSYVLHVLRADDLFLDVGANVGPFTILACAARGAHGYSFEPVPSTFARLSDNLRLNGLGERVRALNVGVGEQSGELVFSQGLNSMNHVLTDGESREGAITVPVVTLDSAVEGEPTMIKIDVEGFELPVLRGAERILSSPRLHSVIIEINGNGERYGYSDKEIFALMERHGFAAHAYDPLTRSLAPLSATNKKSKNTLFVRDVERVRALVSAAPKIRLRGLAY